MKIVLLSLGPAALSAQAPLPGHSRFQLRTTLDSLVRRAPVDLDLAGVSVLVVQGSDTLVARASGYADLENQVAAGLQTVYRIGSITKQFTAAAILQQVEKGAIHLEDSIGKYLPECARRCAAITVRQLLNHTSGIPNFTDLGDPFLALPSQDPAQRDILGLITNRPLDFSPGTKWSYNNSGYYLLGVILERVTSKPYAEYLAEYVWKPAGLSNTHYCDARALIPRRAHGYDAVGSRFVNAGAVSTTGPFAAAGLCSTAGDLVTWARALRSGKVISQKAYDLMTTPTGAAAREELPYGFGAWVVDAKGRRHVDVFGQMDGFNAVLWDTPSESLTVAVLTNTSGVGAATLGRQLSSVLRGTPAPAIERKPAPVPPDTISLTAEDRAQYLGNYRLPAILDGGPKQRGTMTLRVFDENGRLTAQLTGERPERLVALGDHRFVYAGRPDIRLAFVMAQGRAIKARLERPDGSAKGRRVRE